MASKKSLNLSASYNKVGYVYSRLWLDTQNIPMVETEILWMYVFEFLTALHSAVGHTTDILNRHKPDYHNICRKTLNRFLFSYYYFIHVRYQSRTPNLSIVMTTS